MGGIITSSEKTIHSTYVQVIRKPYTFRDREIIDTQNPLISGVIKGFIEALSYVYVSSGKEELKILKPVNINIKNLVDAVTKCDAERLNQLTQFISLDYVENVAYSGKTCIPGSTVKSLLRSRLELCKASNNKSIFCMYSDTMLTEYPSVGRYGWRHARIWGNVVLENRDPSCNPLEENDYSLCKSCDIFGAPGVIGRIMAGNFCCSNCTEHRDLMYGEKIIAIKPGSKLEGDIVFTSLSIEDLGILFISMGLKQGSQIGVEILVGKHKYAYKDMGRARFNVVSIVFPLRFNKVLDNLKLNYHIDGFTIVCRDDCVKKLIDISISRALASNELKQLENIYGFSEAKERDKHNVAM